MRSIVDLCGNPVVFGPWLKDKATWGAWEAFLCVLFGLPMSERPSKRPTAPVRHAPSGRATVTTVPRQRLLDRLS